MKKTLSSFVVDKRDNKKLNTTTNQSVLNVSITEEETAENGKDDVIDVDDDLNDDEDDITVVKTKKIDLNLVDEDLNLSLQEEDSVPL